MPVQSLVCAALSSRKRSQPNPTQPDLSSLTAVSIPTPSPSGILLLSDHARPQAPFFFSQQHLLFVQRGPRLCLDVLRRLCLHHQEPARKCRHQGHIPRLATLSFSSRRAADLGSQASLESKERMYPRDNTLAMPVLTPAVCFCGQFPCAAGNRIRDQGRWRHQPEEGRHNTS